MTMKTGGLVFGVLILLGLMVLPETEAFSRMAPNRGKTAAMPISDITWEKATQKDGLTVTLGSAQANFGRFNFYCNLDAEGRGSLVTLIARGGGELPPQTEKLFLLINDNRSATLLQQWYPLANSRQPVQLKAIVTVNSEQLFSVLPKPVLPAGARQPNGISSINWGKVQDYDRVHSLSGKIRVKSGIVKVSWKMSPGQIPELFVVIQSENGKQFGQEEKLYLLENTQAKTTTLFQELQPLKRQRGSASLQPVAVVKTKQLMAKLAELQQIK